LGFHGRLRRWTSHREEVDIFADDEGLDDEECHEESPDEDMAEPRDFVHDTEETSDDLAKMVSDPHVQD
jgi:hypothetical protein